MNPQNPSSPPAPAASRNLTTTAAAAALTTAPIATTEATVVARVKYHQRPYKDPLRELHPSSAVIRAGYRSDLSERAIKPPVFRSSTFEFASAQEGELFFQRAYDLPGTDGKAPGLVYSRLNNPNTEIFEDKMVALEKGSNYASAFPSGMSAISTSIMALVPQGGHLLYTNPVYGGTYFFLHSLCPGRLGITSAGINTSDPQILQESIENGTKRPKRLHLHSQFFFRFSQKNNVSLAY